MKDPRDVLIQHYMISLSQLAQATEAIAFCVTHREAEPDLEPITHLRGNAADPETLKRAVERFRQLITPCVRDVNDARIEIAEGQFCLVRIVLDDDSKLPAIALGFITRCRDADEAKERLAALRRVV